MKVAKSKLVIFSIAVAFISVFFFAYAVQAVYPAPDYNDFCEERIPVNVETINESSCVDADSKWTSYGGKIKGGFDRGGWCDFEFNCRGEYDTVRDVYERNVFFANLIIGLIVLIVAFFLGLEAVSSGLMGGAVMLIVYGSMRYWSELSDIWRTMMLGVALVILIWLGYKKLAD